MENEFGVLHLPTKIHSPFMNLMRSLLSGGLVACFHGNLSCDLTTLSTRMLMMETLRVKPCAVGTSHIRIKQVKQACNLQHLHLTWDWWSSIPFCPLLCQLLLNLAICYQAWKGNDWMNVPFIMALCLTLMTANQSGGNTNHHKLANMLVYQAISRLF